MKSYCVTGARGVVASWFAKERLESCDEVALLDDGGDARHVFNMGDSLAIMRHRLGTRIETSTWLSVGIDRIFHAAASTGIPYSGQAPLDDWSRNVDGTIEVLEAVRAAEKPPATVVLSSVKPYATNGLHALERDDHYKLSGFGINERAELLPDEIYAASKAAQSLVCQAYARTYDLPIVVFRCSNLCGNAAVHGPRHGWVGWLCIQAALGWTIEIQGSGKQTRDILFASDVHDAAMLAFSAVEAGDIEKGRIYNLGGGSDNLISVLQLVEMLRGMGAKFETKQAPGRKHEDMLFCTDSSLIQRELGWERKVSVRESVARIYEWACQNRDALAEVYKEHAP